MLCYLCLLGCLSSCSFFFCFFFLLSHLSLSVNSGLIKAIAVLLLQYHVRGYQHTTKPSLQQNPKRGRIQLQPSYTSTLFFFPWLAQPQPGLPLADAKQFRFLLLVAQTHMTPPLPHHAPVISSLPKLAQLHYLSITMWLFRNHERGSGRGGMLNSSVLSFCPVTEWDGWVEKKKKMESSKGMRQGKKNYVKDNVFLGNTIQLLLPQQAVLLLCNKNAFYSSM